MAAISINGREINNHGEPYIVAEISANHLGDLERAIELIKTAHDCGADGVKIQCYEPGDLTLNSNHDGLVIPTGCEWAGRTLWDVYTQAQTPRDWWKTLAQVAYECGLDFIASIFNPDTIPVLRSIGVDAYKVASFELNYTQLLRALVEEDKPIILSCGMSTRKEVKTALNVLGDTEVAVLKCTSAYPAKAEDAMLGAIPVMIFAHCCPVGLSDHTLSPIVPAVAVSLGACIIEKHLTLRRSDGGPDAAFSLEPQEFTAMVRASKDARAAIGSKPNDPHPDSPVDAEDAMKTLRRSVYVSADVAKGDTFTTDNLRVIRPGYGLEPARLDDVLGKVAARDIPFATPLREEMVA